MPRRSVHRRFAALWVICSLLFSQFALASYVCPGPAGAVAMARTMAAGEPCPGMDSMQAVLCHPSAVSDVPSIEIAKVAAPSLPAVLQVLVVPPAMDAAERVSSNEVEPADTRPPPGPLFLATRRLRV